MGDSPTCIQTNSKIITVKMGLGSLFLPGSTGLLSSTSMFYPQFSPDYSQFAVFESSEPWTDSMNSYNVDWTGGVLTGPKEAGFCDPVVLRVRISSAMPHYFIWDCPSCTEGSNLDSILAQEMGPTVILSPDAFDGIEFYEPIVIRVQYKSIFTQQIELLHDMLKVPHPTPPLLISAPAAVREGQKIELAAFVRPSVCESTLVAKNSSLQFVWNQSSTDNTWYPALTVHQWKYTSQSFFNFQVQTWWTSYPAAVTTSVVSVVALPKNYRMHLRQLSEYALIATITEEVPFLGETWLTGLSPSFMWTCNMQGFTCRDADGNLLQFQSDSEYLMISPTYASSGRLAPFTFHFKF
jgi:hypothetical protein